MKTLRSDGKNFVPLLFHNIFENLPYEKTTKIAAYWSLIKEVERIKDYQSEQSTSKQGCYFIAQFKKVKVTQ